MQQSFKPLTNLTPPMATATLPAHVSHPSPIDPDLLLQIQPLLLANAQSGRMSRAMATGRYPTSGDYTQAVARYYRVWQPTVQRLVNERDEGLWAELFDQLQCIGRGYLQKAVPYLSDSLEATATACAEDTAIAIMRRRYPFDCDFMAWTFATLRTVCRRSLYQLCNATDLLAHCQTQLDDNDVVADAVDDGDDGPDDLLAWATPRLATANRRQFARLYYYEAKSYDQIAAEMGKSLCALYKLNSDTLANYRQLLNRPEAGQLRRRMP